MSGRRDCAQHSCLAEDLPSIYPGCFVCLSVPLTPSQNPLGCQSPYQIRSLKGNCRESSLYLLRGHNYLDVEYITNVPLPVLHMKWLVLEIEIFTQPRLTPNRLVHILAALQQCISQSASAVLIAPHMLKSKLELDKNFANRGASRNHFEMPASVSRRLHNFLDSAPSPILRNKADV